MRHRRAGPRPTLLPGCPTPAASGQWSCSGHFRAWSLGEGFPRALCLGPGGRALGVGMLSLPVGKGAPPTAA